MQLVKVILLYVAETQPTHENRNILEPEESDGPLGDSFREIRNETGNLEPRWFDGPYRFHGVGLS